MSLPWVGITQGDENGVGPEVIQKALGNPTVYEICKPLLIGDPQLFVGLKKKYPVELFFPHQKPKNSSYAALETGTSLLLQNKISAIVTAPVNKKKISADENIQFLGHTGYLQKKCEDFYKKPFFPTMIFVGRPSETKEKLALVTTHVPLKEIPHILSEDILKKTISNVHKGLITFFGFKKPSMALLGLNPHAGEEGLLGNEEQTVFKNVFLWAKKEKFSLHGPYSADSFFAKKWKEFDITISIYHDQGLPAFKLRNYPHSVNLTLGLPIIRTSVDHGVGYDIAHSGVADETSMIEAIKLSAQMIKMKEKNGKS